MESRIILVGGGAFAREVINWTDHVYNKVRGGSIKGFLDENPNALDGFDYQVPYLGKIDSFHPVQGDKLLMAVGDPFDKKRIFEMFKKRNAQFIQIIHPTAVIANSAKLGEGVVVCPQAFISADAVIGDAVAINGCTSIGHDVVVGNYCTFSSHVDLTGWVKIAECVFFGTGARVLPKVKIAFGARIGAGAVIMRSVAENGVMYAPPAKKL
ncbi:acetyltransferase [Polynucleobacter paneuropaeus]|nr:acetyltransferase [Polynucleobacter paneuropaeus]